MIPEGVNANTKKTNITRKNNIAVKTFANVPAERTAI